MKFLQNILFVAFISTIFSTFSNGQSSNLGTVCAESQHTYGVSAGQEGSTFVWAIEQGRINGANDQDTIEVQWGYNTGTFLMEVVEVTNAGCTGVPVMATVTVQAPEVDLGMDFAEICDQDSMVFDATGDYVGNYTIQWHDSSYAPTYTATQSELIVVRVVDGDGCQRYDSVDFTVNPLPIVNLGGDTVLCDVENPLTLSAFDNTGSPFVSYDWISSTQGGIIGTNPTFDVYPGHDTISLVVSDFKNCYNSDTIVIYACDVSEMFRDMVNTFTPNDDNVNDVWNITEFMHLFPDAVLEVFDRWGRLVYRTTNVAFEPWDGTSNGRPMPMDSYFFVLELNYMNLEALSGTVNLIR